MSVQSFGFKFASAYRALGAVFGVTPSNTKVVVTADTLEVKFGPWHLETPLSNIVEVRPTGPYSFIKTAGPAHLSFSDRGATFATNGERGLCIKFHEPVPGIDPTRTIKHPAVTVTVDDVEALEKALIG